MASYDSWTNVLTGISQGTFDQIYLRDSSGNIVDLLTLIAAGSGGGGTVTSAALPLSISSGALSLTARTVAAQGRSALRRLAAGRVSKRAGNVLPAFKAV